MSEELSKKNGCVVFTPVLPMPLTPDDIKALFDRVKLINADYYKDAKWFLLNLSGVQTASNNFASIMCRVAAHIEENGLKLTVIADPKLCQIIIKNGVERMVNFATSEDEFYKIQGIDADKENLRIFLNTLLESTITTMKVLLELEAIKTTVHIVKDSAEIPRIEAGAMAGIISAHFTGNLIIGFNLDIFKKAMSRFLQMEVVEFTPEIKDGAAEFLNVIIGQTKTKLNALGFEIRQVIPSVIMGQNIEISPMRKQSFVRIECETEIGSMQILLSTSTIS